MDKRWMQLRNRSLPDYVTGVQEFISFAKLHIADGEKIKCPCYNCNNYYFLFPEQVHDHLILNGMLRSYDPWVYHGETISPNEGEHMSNGYDYVECNDDNFEDATLAMLNELNQESLFNEWANSSTSNSCPAEGTVPSNPFAQMFQEASHPMYAGCNASRISVIVKLLHLKTLNGWSNKSFDMLLQLLKQILPPESNLPSSFYKAKQVIRDIGLNYEKIHACKNDCILFWNEYQDLDMCPICSTPRYKDHSSSGKKIPHKILRYFPLTPRLQRLYVSTKTARDMRWHHEMRVEDGILRHPADSDEWKKFDDNFPLFASEPRNVKLGLASDGFNPFDNMSTSYSMWPVIVVPYNLPPWRCMKDPFLMLSLLIPGPKSPGNDIDVYLQPLVHELKQLWEVGVQTYDASTNELFQMHAALLWTINDFPAYGNLSGWSTKGKQACPTCNVDASFLSLKHGRKIVYVGHRRFLPNGHKLRNSRMYNGKELRPPPKYLSGYDILEQLEDVRQPTFGKGPNKERKRKRAVTDNNWRKRSIFFQLPYWRSLQLRHNLDVMHIEKNVCDSLLGTMMNIEGKTKDTYKTRLDLEDLGIMKELHPIRTDGAVYLAPACYMLNDAEKKKFCQFLLDVKLPDGYASNISRCVNIADSKITGLKSHDCHILMQRLMPIALRGTLRKDVCGSIIQLCLFFKELTSKTLKKEALDQLDKSIAVTLSSLEKMFPPAFFDVMVHLPIHLAREALLAGPCQFRWMYPFERYLHKLKCYVRNKAQPEGSIAEGYIANECLTFCSMYLNDVETRFNRPERNYDASVAAEISSFSTFSHKGRGMGAPTYTELTMIEWMKIRWYVLNNSAEVLPYIEAHREQLEGENVPNMYAYQQAHFPKWLLHRLHQLEINEGESQLDNIKRIARGPDKRVVRYSGCIIDGHRFRTIDRDSHRKTQNSGVVVKGDHNGEEMNFYGILKDVFELSYGGRDHKVFVFKCDWWDIGSRSRVNIDEFKFLSMKVTKTWYKDDPYVLASQAEEVVYLPDPKMGKDWVVVERVHPRNLYDMQVTKSVVDPPDDEAYQQDECQDFEDFGFTDEMVEYRIRTDMDGRLVNVTAPDMDEDLQDSNNSSTNGSSSDVSDDDS